MAHHDELLALALGVFERSAGEQSQAELRRAVSTAYYALFHLLIHETTQHWNLESSRPGLGRMFEHGVMRKVSLRLAQEDPRSFAGVDPKVVSRLRSLCKAFCLLQEQRKIADYDNSRFWLDSEAKEVVETAARAFEIWQEIRGEKIAQDYLVAMLIRPRE